jgi:hypothetical protein
MLKLETDERECLHGKHSSSENTNIRQRKNKKPIKEEKK